MNRLMSNVIGRPLFNPTIIFNEDFVFSPDRPLSDQTLHWGVQEQYRCVMAKNWVNTPCKKYKHTADLVVKIARKTNMRMFWWYNSSCTLWFHFLVFGMREMGWPFKGTSTSGCRHGDVVPKLYYGISPIDELNSQIVG